MLRTRNQFSLGDTWLTKAPIYIHLLIQKEINVIFQKGFVLTFLDTDFNETHTLTVSN